VSAARARTPLIVLALLATACSSQQAAPSAGGSQPQAQVQPGATLVGTVGTADEPEAYEIALTKEDGQAVDTVAAGTYTVVVDDYAQIHNFHLMGDGVDAATEVAGTGKKSFEVTFQAGEYRYVCDPHPSMRGDLRVL
jgi:plastocyanin